MSKIFVFFLMLFCHIVDDYYLQGILASMKQKKWWKSNAPEQLYQYDYIIALVMHGFSWAFMVMLPIAVFYHFNVSGLFCMLLLVNCAIHAVVDNAKANLLKINLVTDQVLHIAQISLTYIALMSR